MPSPPTRPIEPHGASLRDGYRTAEIVDTIMRAGKTGATEEVRYQIGRGLNSRFLVIPAKAAIGFTHLERPVCRV